MNHYILENSSTTILLYTPRPKRHFVFKDYVIPSFKSKEILFFHTMILYYSITIITIIYIVSSLNYKTKNFSNTTGPYMWRFHWQPQKAMRTAGTLLATLHSLWWSHYGGEVRNEVNEKMTHLHLQKYIYIYIKKQKAQYPLLPTTPPWEMQLN